MGRPSSVCALVFVILASAQFVPSVAAAQDAAEFYKSHSLTLGVPNSAGGGYDVYARALARHLGNHIPGKPNAIVHNVALGGTVRVWTAATPAYVVLSVENTGEILSPQVISTLTEPFQRGNERTRGDHAGVGLGLAIVKSIVKAHDGTLTLTPRDAGGLQVTVQLPAASP